MNPELTPCERSIISATYFSANKPVAQISKETGYRPHVVRYALKKLFERQAIRARLFLNPFAFGLTEFQAFLSVDSMGTDIRDALIQKLIESPLTTHVGTIGGAFQIDVMFVAPNLVAAQAFFDTIAVNLPRARFLKQVAPCLSVTLFQPGDFMRKRGPRATLSYGPVTEVTELDKTDRGIITALQEQKLLSFAEAARRVGISQSSLDYRVKSLMKRGVIIGFGISVPVYQDGLSPFLLLLRARKHTASFAKKLSDHCGERSVFSYVIHNFGAWDFQIGVRLQDPRDIVDVTEDLKITFREELATFETIPVLETLKLMGRYEKIA